MTDYSIARGYGGRPWVTTDGQPLKWAGRRPWNAHLYERVSDMAKVLDDGSGMTTWNCANTAFGIAKDRGLYEQFCAMADEHEDPWNASKAMKAEIKGLVAQAQSIGGSDRKSGRGSGFHRSAHVVDEGRDLLYAPPEIIPYLECYAEAMQRYKVIGYERFIATDEVKAAGSADRIVVDTETGEVHVMDIKTGAHDPNYCMGVTVQVAIMANGEYYDQETGRREQIDCSKVTGLLCHVPLAEEPQCNIYPLDLERGWRLAKMVPEVLEARKMKVGKRARIVAVSGA